MTALEYDIYLDVKLLSFDQSNVTEKNAIILEQAKQLPAEIESFFIENEKVPCGGFIHISLKASRSAVGGRTILSEIRKIPMKKWYSYVGKVYNNGQKALQQIKFIGKTLEKIAPDAYQKVKIHYHISATEEKQVSYWIHVNRLDNTSLLVFNGEVLLK